MRPSGDPKVLEQRRLQAIALFQDGFPPVEIARKLGVGRRSVRLWKAQFLAGGAEALRARPTPGRPWKLGRAARMALETLLLRGARACGIYHGPVDLPPGRSSYLPQLRSPLSRRPPRAPAEISGLEPAKAGTAGHRARRGGHSTLGQDDLAQGKKNASRLGASLIFLDESGFLLAPLVRRTWAPQGQTPILRQRTNTFRKLSVIASLVVSPRRDRVRLFFRFYPNANINADRVKTFLRHLRRHVRGPCFLLWDRFPAHRARSVQSDLVEAMTWRSEFLPAYAPELNPCENVWGYMKMNSRANEVVFDLIDLTGSVRRHGRALQRSDRLLRSFLKHTPLFLRLE